MTFAAALRAMLRQAPNIIMIGEIRDLGNRQHRHQRRAHRSLGVQHPAHQRRARRRRPPRRHRREAVPDRLRGAGDDGPAPRPEALPDLQSPGELTDKEMRALSLDVSRVADATISARSAARNAARPATTAGSGIFEIFMVDDEVRHMINTGSPPPIPPPRARTRHAHPARGWHPQGARRAHSGGEVVHVTMSDTD